MTVDMMRAAPVRQTTEEPMKKIRLSAFTIFLLFFGVATLEAFQTHNWVKATFWMAIGMVFLLANNFRVPRNDP
jgi:fatty acid desaturase